MHRIYIDVAQRERKCHECKGEIPTGIPHFVTSTGLRYTNICYDCLDTFHKSLRQLYKRAQQTKVILKLVTKGGKKHEPSQTSDKSDTGG